MSTNIVRKIPNTVSLSVVERAISTNHSIESITKATEKIVKQTSRELSRSAIKADGDTEKVMKNTRMVATPIATEMLAFSVAAAYHGTESEIAKRAEKIDFHRLENETIKQGFSLETYENNISDSLGKNLNGQERKSEQAALLKYGRTNYHPEGLENTSALSSSISNVRNLYANEELEQKITKSQISHEQSSILRSNTYQYVIEQQKKVEDLTTGYVEQTTNSLKEALNSDDAKVVEKTKEYLNSDSFKSKTSLQLENISSKSFGYRNSLISSSKLKFDIKDTAIDEIKQSIIENREVNINKILCEARLEMRNLQNDPNAVTDLYKLMATRIRQNGGKITDPVLKAQIAATKRAKTLSNNYKRLHSPKRFVRTGSKILTKPFQQSETMKGISMSRNMVMGVVGLKMVANPAFNTAYNASVMILKQARVNAFAKEYNITKQSARKAINTNHGIYQKWLSKTGRGKLPDKVRLRDFLKNPVVSHAKMALKKDFSNFLLNRSKNILKNESANFATKFFAERLQNRANYMAGNIEKDVLKHLNKLSGKAFRHIAGQKAGELAGKAGAKFAATKVGSAVTNAAGKAGAKIAATKTFGVAVKTYKGASKAIGATNMFFKAIGAALKEAIGAIASKIALAIAFVGKILLAAVGIFVSFFILLQLALVVVNQYYELTAYVDRFQSFYTTALFDTNEETFIKMLRECHDERLAELRKIQKSYEVGDIQYPSGEQENYKELYCAMAVQCQYHFDLLSKKEMKDIAKDLYDQTHRTSWEPYEFKTDDGVTHKAVHVFCDILRGEGVAIEAIGGGWLEGAGEIGAGGSSAGAYFDNGSPRASATGVVIDDWMNIVDNVKRVIAATGCIYNQEGHVTVSVNDQIKTIRQDCSGYVSACLQIYGSLNDTWSSYDFTYNSSIPGFTRLSFSGWDNLNPGDIISYNNGGKGHVEIFAYNSGGYHYVYSNGSTTSVRSSVPTTDKRTYTTVWRPENPGSTIEGFVEGEEGVTTEIEKWDPTGLLGITNQPSYSNTASVTFDEVTGNEEGYEDTLIADINAEIAKAAEDSPFTGSLSYDSAATNPHSLTKNSSKASSWDFVRYIYAKHGVHVAMDISDLEVLEGARVFDDEKLRVGNVLVYAPNKQILNKIQAELNGQGKSITTAVFSHRTKYANEKYVEGVDDPNVKPVSYRELMLSECIPLIYIGNGKAVAYSRDLLDTNYSDASAAYSLNSTSVTYASSQAQIRTYDLRSLDPTRIYRTQRYNKFTVNPVYGSTPYFEGWTDWNIACFEELVSDDCWDLLEKDLTKEDFAYTNSDGEIVEKIDFSWYKEDLFSGNDFYHDGSHADQFKNELSPIIVAYYDDYGILPSVAFSTAAALSDYRSTDESLRYFNIYEMYEEYDPDSAGDSDKFSYNAKCDATITTEDYKKFNSYEEAYSFWMNSVVLKNGITRESMYAESNVDFDRQMSILRGYNVISDKTLQFAKAIYTSGKDPNGSRNHIYMNTQLKELDALATHRKEIMDNMTDISTELHDTNWAPERTSSSGAIGEGNESSDKQKAKHLYELLKQYKELDEELTEINTDNQLPETPNYTTLKTTYDADLAGYASKLKHLKDARNNNPSAYVQYYTCNGHDWERDEDVPDGKGGLTTVLKTGTDYHNDGNPMTTPCDDCDSHYESWNDVKVME